MLTDCALRAPQAKFDDLTLKNEKLEAEISFNDKKCAVAVAVACLQPSLN